MSSALLLEHYARIADAPDAIARLRRFILNLAVRGKLVAQQEPWQTLPIESCLEKLPDGRFIHQGWSPQCDADPSSDPTVWGVLKTTAVQDGLFLPEHNKKLPSKLDPKVKLTVYKDDILMTCAGPRARCGIPCLVGEVRERLIFSGKMYRFRAQQTLIYSEYLVLFLRSEDTQAAIDAMKTGSSESGMNLTQDRFRTLHIAFGNLDEQRKIIATVQELMALCDQLETARAEREAGRDRLTAATLARLNAPDPETFPADARFALDNLTPLTTRPDQITQLRQTILSLAVRGKLVEHNEADGTGLDFMAALPMKEQGNGRGRRKIATRKIEPDEEYLDIPDNWTWARIHELGFTQTGTSPSSANPDFFGDFIPFVKPSDLDGAKIYYEGPGLSEEGVSQSRVAPAATVLMVCIGATLGKVNITDRNVCFNQQINSVTPYLPGTSAFLALTLKATGFQELAWSKAGTGTLPIISKGRWEILPVPVPPLAEQDRIVAKVDELMALCDQLEASLTAGEQTRSRLLESVLQHALEPA